MAKKVILAGASGLVALCLTPVMLLMAPPLSAGEALETEPTQEAQQEHTERTRSTVTALARLEPEGEVIEIGAPLGDRIERLTAGEGDWKDVGEILAYLESHQERFEQTDLAASRLTEARARLEAELEHAKSVLHEAEIQRRRVEEAGPLEIRAQEATTQGLKAELDLARKDLTRLENLASRDSAARQELDHQASLVESLASRYRAAQAQLERLQTAHDLDTQLARARVDTARAALHRAATSSEVQSLENNLSLAKASLERTLIRAPVSGQVLRVLARPGETTGSRPLLLMGNTRQMYALAEVYETDAHLIKAGQEAVIESPALVGEIKGEVVEVGRMVSRNEILDIDPSADTDRRVVRVKIRLDRSEQAANFIHLQVTVSIKVS